MRSRPVAPRRMVRTGAPPVIPMIGATRTAGLRAKPSDRGAHRSERDQRLEEPAGARIAHPYGQGLLAGFPIGRDVAKVVHHQQRAREAADRHARGEGEPGQPLGEDVGGSGRGHDPEEHEDEQLAEPVVAVGLGAAGVEPPCGDGGGPDHEQLRPDDRGEGLLQRWPPPRRRRAPRASTAPAEASPLPTKRIGPTRTVSVPLHAVAVVVGVVRADLQRQRHDERGADPPPDDASALANGTGGPDGHRHDGSGQGARPGAGQPSVHRGAQTATRQQWTFMGAAVSQTATKGCVTVQARSVPTVGPQGPSAGG